MRTCLRALIVAVALCWHAAANAEWHEAKSKHFIIYADLKPNEIRSYAERLERFDQAVRALRGMDDPALTDAQRLTVYALRNETAVAKLAKMGSGVRGFYEPRASGSVAFVPRRAGSKAFWDLDTDEIFFHEYSHHLQLQFAAFALPAWVVEGFAEFFATAKIEKDGSVLVGSPPQYRAYSLFNENSLQLDQIVGATYGELSDGQVDLLYGKGWLLTHYLSFEPSRQGQLTRYLEKIQQGQTALDAAKASFGDLKQLDRELNTYMRRKFQGYRVHGTRLVIGDIAVRPLSRGEAAIMDVRIRSKRGVNRETAPAVAADARKIAQAYPNEPFVQGTLAEAEYDAGDFKAAEAAADRALAADPKHVHALIYKGRIRMALAKAKPEKADWADVRSWFTKANGLDTENAEPLMLFYLTYNLAGAQPSKNAVEALLYAVALAPQDDGLRLLAVRQMLVDNRLAEAKRMFAPMAFQPHASLQFREFASRIMAAIGASDGKGALKILEAGPHETTKG